MGAIHANAAHYFVDRHLNGPHWRQGCLYRRSRDLEAVRSPITTWRCSQTGSRLFWSGTALNQGIVQRCWCAIRSSFRSFFGGALKLA